MTISGADEIGVDFMAGCTGCTCGDRFFNNNDGTITDCRTNLIWLKNSYCYGSQHWGTVIAFAAGLNSGECGLTDESVEGDWHLASKEELQGIGTDPQTTWWRFYASYYEITWTEPGLPFVDILHSYWSSTINGDFPDYAWFVGIAIGYTDYNPKYLDGALVWPVRDPN